MAKRYPRANTVDWLHAENERRQLLAERRQREDAFYAKQVNEWYERRRVESGTGRTFLPPGGHGYGGADFPWPFSIPHAVKNPGYATGVARASVNKLYHPAWREAATRDLSSIKARLDDRAKQFQDAYEAIVLIETMEEFK